MTPPVVGNFSPANNNMCDQNQVNASLEGLSQDLQQNPMSPMSPMSPMQTSHQQSQTQQSSSHPAPQQSSQNQLPDMPNMVDSIGVNIIDPYRRTGNL